MQIFASDGVGGGGHWPAFRYSPLLLSQVVGTLCLDISGSASKEDAVWLALPDKTSSLGVPKLTKERPAGPHKLDINNWYDLTQD